MKKKAMAKLLSSMIIFASIGIIRRGIDMPSVVLVFFRAFIGFVFLYIYSKIYNKKLNKTAIKNNIAILILSGVFLSLNWIFLFEAFQYTSVSVATLLYYLAPILAIIISTFVFRERLTYREVGLTLLAMLGMILLSAIYSQEVRGTKGMVFALIAAGFYSLVIILNKYLKYIDSFDSTLTQLCVAAIFMFIYLIITEQINFHKVDSKSIILTLVLGIVHTGLSYLLYFDSISSLPAKVVAIFSYLDPILALIFSTIFLGESLSISQILGVILLLSSMILLELGRIQNKEI